MAHFVKPSSVMDQFVKSLAGRFPGLQPLLDEHIRDQHGEILSHIFFWAVVNYVLSLIRLNSHSSLNEAREIVKFMEDHYLEGDENYEVRNLIHVSFLEDIQHEGDVTQKLVAMLGPKLTALWKEEGFSY